MGEPQGKRRRASQGQERRRTARRMRAVKWVGAAVVFAAVAYAVSQSSGVAYTERDIKAVDFSALNSKQKTTALQAANRASCPCGCGMTLAQCVSTDSTCPIREENVKKIRRMVDEAME
jgi:hypothetical protein